MLERTHSELEGLAVDGLAGHAGDGPQDAQGWPKPDTLDVVEQGLQRQRQHGVTDVDGDRDAVVDVQRGSARRRHDSSSMSSWMRNALW